MNENLVGIPTRGEQDQRALDFEGSGPRCREDLEHTRAGLDAEQYGWHDPEKMDAFGI
jgi:hypothetical protein